MPLSLPHEDQNGNDNTMKHCSNEIFTSIFQYQWEQYGKCPRICFSAVKFHETLQRRKKSSGTNTHELQKCNYKFTNGLNFEVLKIKMILDEFY